MNIKNQNILDVPVPSIAVPILAPSKTTAKAKSLKSIAKNIYDAVRKKTSEFADWILRYVPQSIKKPANERVEALKQQVSDIFKKWYPQSFKIRESDSALKGFTKQYVIDGREGYDPQSFLAAVETQVTNLLSRSRQTNVNLILACTMEKRDIRAGEVITTNAPFRSKN